MSFGKVIGQVSSTTWGLDLYTNRRFGHQSRYTKRLTNHNLITGETPIDIHPRLGKQACVCVCVWKTRCFPRQKRHKTAHTFTSSDGRIPTGVRAVILYQKNKLLQNWQPEAALLLLLANKHKNINYTDKLRHTQATTLKIVTPVGDLSPDQYDCNPL